MCCFQNGDQTQVLAYVKHILYHWTALQPSVAFFNIFFFFFFLLPPQSIWHKEYKLQIGAVASMHVKGPTFLTTITFSKQITSYSVKIIFTQELPERILGSPGLMITLWELPLWKIHKIISFYNTEITKAQSMSQSPEAILRLEFLNK